jgi:peptidoglycan-associated lipoprotein
MKLASKILSLAVASAALVLAGCTKKPTRPDPSQTALGLHARWWQHQLAGDRRQPEAAFPPTDLVSRGEGFDANNRTAPPSRRRPSISISTVRHQGRRSARSSRRPRTILDKNPGYKLLLEGHCDWRGTAEYNLGLGDRRANATRKYLESLGVTAQRLETLSKGSLEAMRNADDATMTKDRRVDLVVVNPAASAPKAL